jgi:hypothetical protein
VRRRTALQTEIERAPNCRPTDPGHAHNELVVHTAAGGRSVGDREWIPGSKGEVF